ncbi:TylF/MycF/NovP-related O-methyltransferase [Fibrobacterota bacterium]
MLRKWCRKVIAKSGKQFIKHAGYHADYGFFTIHAPPFLKDESFLKSYRRSLSTVHDRDPGYPWRIHVAHWAAGVASKLHGDFVECGVHVGFISTSIMSYLDWNTVNKRYFLIDTFQGPDVSQFTAEEVEQGRKKEVERLQSIGGYDYDLPAVETNFREWERVVFVKGLIPDVLHSVDVQSVAFLHIDLNCAAPEIAAVNYFWDAIVPGGVILLDDYAFKGFEIQGREMRKLAGEKGTGILSLPTGQGVMVKPPSSKTN